MGRQIYYKLQEELMGARTRQMGLRGGSQVGNMIVRGWIWGVTASSWDGESTKVSDAGKWVDGFAVKRDGVPRGKHIWGGQSRATDCWHSTNMINTQGLHGEHPVSFDVLDNLAGKFQGWFL